MTPKTVQTIRHSLGMTQREFAEALNLSEKNGARAVRKYESTGCTGAVARLIEYIDEFGLIKGE